MTEDTRDIAIRTEEKVESLLTRVSALEQTLHTQTIALAERRGAERLAQWIIGLVSGSAGATVLGLIMKFGGFLSATPIPK